jgi:SAM-dependent methyltransferase
VSGVAPRNDYDDPLFRSGVSAADALAHSIFRDEYRDIHPQVADRIEPVGGLPVLDLGCGRTVLGTLLRERGIPWVGIDQSPTQLANGAGPRVRGDARRLPFRDDSFGAVATLYTLYHFDEPREPLREAARVLAPGGMFVTCAPSRENYPELLPLLPSEPAATFDAENAAEVVAAVFDDVRVEPWEMWVFRLPDADAVWRHLVARMVEPAAARHAAESVRTPLWVRAKGALVWAHKRG